MMSGGSFIAPQNRYETMGWALCPALLTKGGGSPGENSKLQFVRNGRRQDDFLRLAVSHFGDEFYIELPAD